MGAIYLIRHGQASFGSADYDQLSRVGVEQAGVLGTALKSRIAKVDLQLCGGMRRHHQTAAGVLDAMAIGHDWEDDDGWREYDHVAVLAAYRPQWADQTVMTAELTREADPRRAFQQAFAAAVQRWVEGLHNDDYPESWAGFCARIDSALLRLRERLGKSQTALVFTSGGPIAAVAQQMLRLDDEHTYKLNWTLANAGVTKLIYSERSLYLSTLNEHAHFEGGDSRLITYR